MPTHVRELMTSTVHTVPLTSSLNEAARVLWENDCGIVPVVDESDRVTGVVTDRDICMAAYTKNQALSAIPVEGVASRELVTCRPEDEVEDVLALMETHQVRRIPVTDGERRIQGIVSLNDLARAGDEGQVDNAALVTTLATICAPRSRAGVPPVPATAR